jgi:hypothetical protein
MGQAWAMFNIVAPWSIYLQSPNNIFIQQPLVVARLEKHTADQYVVIACMERTRWALHATPNALVQVPVCTA